MTLSQKIKDEALRWYNEEKSFFEKNNETEISDEIIICTAVIHATEQCAGW